MNMRQGWAKAMTRIAARFGFHKMPSGIGWSGGGGILGFSSLGSARKQCEAYQSHVYKCVTLIYRRAISVPMNLYKERGDEDEEIKHHPVIDLLKKPNELMTGRDLKSMTQMHLDLTGRAFWLKVFNGLGRPVELWPLPAANFNRLVFNDAQTELLGFEFSRSSGAPITYPVEQVVYFRYPHPLYMLDGASPIQAMAFAYDTDMAIRVYQRNFFQNSARADVTLESDQDIQLEDAKRILMGWKQAHQGVDKAWEPAILDKGLKANILSVAAKDFEFATLAGWTKEDILEAYNTPAGKLGTVKDVNKANGLALDITFNSECISPRLDGYEETASLGLLPHYDTGLYFKHVSCIPRDLEHDLKERESNLKSKYTTINEERQREGREPVAWGDAPFVNISEMQWGETLGVSRDDDGGGKAEGKTEKSKEETGKSKEEREKGGAADRLRVLHERQVAARAKPYRAYLIKYFKGQRKEVIDNLERVFPRIEGAITGMSMAKVKDWLDAHKDLSDEILFDLSVANEALKDGSGPYLEGAVMAAGEGALNLVASDVTFDLYSQHVVDFMVEQGTILEGVNGFTHRTLRNELRAGFELGEAMPDIAKRVGKIFDQAETYRSLRIAQTEINSAANRGSLEGYRQSGAVERKGWLAGPDARDTHAEAAARYSGDGAIPLNEDFIVGAGSGPAPGSIGLAEEDIH